MPARPAISLRTLILALVVVLVTYVAGFSVYLAVAVAPAAERLVRGSAAVYALVRELTARAARMEELLRETGALSLDDPVARTRQAATLRASLDSVRDRVTALRYAELPDQMRAPLGRADAALALLHNRLTEYAVFAGLGRRGPAGARLVLAESASVTVQRELFVAQQLGMDDLARRERALTRAVRRQVRVAVAWVIAGLILLPILLVTFHVRLTRPLGRLQIALHRLGRGELGERLPVDRLDELGRLTEHFNETSQHLQARAEHQGRFVAAGELLAGVAHEVNNPLMAVAALATTAKDEPGLSARLRGDLDQILRQTQRAGRLVRGLLRFVNPHDRVDQPVDLNQVMADALELVAFRFPGQGIELVDELSRPLPATHADGSRLEQVFVNLLSNATDELRHVPPPRRLTIQSWREGEQVCAAVADNGRGIPPEMTDRLFRPFASTKGKTGTGLGLYISRMIVREAGGTLSVDPAHSPGTRFVCRIPCAPVEGAAPAGRAAAAAGRPPPDLAGLRVLVVDDEHSIRTTLVRFLEHRGARAVAAADGLEALDAVDREHFDVIVADIAMPRLDGLELHAAIQARRPGLAERMLLLSGGFQIEQGAHLGIGADRLLLKPIDLAELVARIRAIAPAG
jgi:signal transduction histidine kinase